MQLELVYMCVIFSGFLSAPHVLYSVPHWRTTSSPLLYLLIRSSGYKHAAVSCRQQRDELNIINRGETKKKIIIINNKKYIRISYLTCYTYGGPMSRRETTTKISSSPYIIWLSFPLLSWCSTFDDRKRVVYENIIRMHGCLASQHTTRAS